MDIFALGLILYQMVFSCSHHPLAHVPGGKESRWAALRSHDPLVLPDRNRFGTEVPGLKETLAAALHKEPHKRASAKQLLKMEFITGAK